MIATHDPIVSLRDQGETNVTRGAPPCIHALGCPTDKPQHLMGIDSVVRDEFSRVVYGVAGLAPGRLPHGRVRDRHRLLHRRHRGLLRRRPDNVLMRVMDVVLSFPSLILAIAIVTVLGPGLINAQLAIGIVAIPIYARVMRASVLSVREADFVTASRALGESSAGILSRRILPNALTPLIVQGTLGIGGAILEVAALSFVGLGAQPPARRMGLHDRARPQPVLLGAAPDLLPGPRDHA